MTFGLIFSTIIICGFYKSCWKCSRKNYIEKYREKVDDPRNYDELVGNYKEGIKVLRKIILMKHPTRIVRRNYFRYYPHINEYFIVKFLSFCGCFSEWFKIILLRGVVRIFSRMNKGMIWLDIPFKLWFLWRKRGRKSFKNSISINKSIKNN